MDWIMQGRPLPDSRRGRHTECCTGAGFEVHENQAAAWKNSKSVPTIGLHCPGTLCPGPESLSTAWEEVKLDEFPPSPQNPETWHLLPRGPLVGSWVVVL